MYNFSPLLALKWSLHHFDVNASKRVVVLRDNDRLWYPNPWGRGVTTIYAGTGCTIFWGAFFEQK